MPKSKKKKNQDFQKVKLKVGRRLQKADNITNASFKTRSVQVVQHIKTGDGTEPTTRRNLNIRDLLNQCQHYNVSVRMDAVSGLRELVTTFPEILEKQLAQVMERVSQLMVDKESVIRSALIKLFQQITPLVGVDKMRPFFPVVSAHVCCAMTHIYEDIQSDSLKILDIFLEYYPSLIMDRSSQIIPNFIEQISHQNLTKKSSAGCRSLSIKPGGKIRAHTWRNQVLLRLSKLLSTLVKSSELSGSKGKVEEELKVVWKDEEEVSCTPFPAHYKKLWAFPGLRTSTMKNVLTREMEERGYNLREGSGVLRLMETILPILLECWVEATATQHRDMEGHLLSMEACALRYNVVKTIQLLWQYAEKVIQGTVHALNITICDIMSFFLTINQKAGYSRDLGDTITQYLLNYLQEENYDSSYTLPVLQVIDRLMANNFQDNEKLHKLLTVLMYRFTQIHDLSKEKKLLLRFFSRLVCKEEVCIREDIKQAFLDSLPALFQSSMKSPVMSSQILDVLSELSSRALDPSTAGISVFIDSVLGVEVGSLTSLDTGVLRGVVELLYRVSSLSEEQYTQLARLVQSSHLPARDAGYLLQVMQHRYNRHRLTIEEQGLYINFLFKCAFDAVECPLHNFAAERDIFSRAVTISETVSDQLLMFPNSEQIVELIFCYLSKALQGRSTGIPESIYLLTSSLIMGTKLKTWKYPMSSHVTEQLMDLLWNYLLVVTDNEKRMAWNILLTEEVTERGRQLISGGEEVLRIFLQKILCELKNCENIEQIHAVQRAAILILNQGSTWPTLLAPINSQPVFDNLEKITGLAAQLGWKKLRTLFSELNKI
uniref:Testis-expressed protein 10 homolog isoform X2 n=1 Tax=Crassostrea virginica TaxID=6565 RepID=A0A8B8BWZ0_CRAVI|nr:testis-expressed protein 10 homolog isoform X2 [Crassostrea virginica]